MVPFADPKVENVFQTYPENVRPKMLALRQLVFDTSAVLGIRNLEETLKWGEPSYLCTSGSTLRMDWKPKEPDHYFLFFHCQSLLVPTFRALYAEAFTFDENRAIRLGLDEKLDQAKLSHCIELTLTYHKVKHLPMLGA